MLTIYIGEILKTFISLFVVMNPLAVVPLYISLTKEMTAEEKNKVINVCSISVMIVLFVSGVAGEMILKIFGISIASFQVGGGVLLGIIAYNMMSAKEEENIEDKSVSRDRGLGLAVVPLTIPMLTGPGAMSMSIVTASKYHNFIGYLYITVAALMIGVVIYFILKSAGRIKLFLGETGMSIMTKVLSLLLFALAVELMANGLRVLLPGLGFIPV